jgi:hypothetical protein
MPKVRWIAVLLCVGLIVSCSKRSSGHAPTNLGSEGTASDWGMAEFTQQVSFELVIELTEPPAAIGGLENQRAPATATIKKLEVRATIADGDSARSLTSAELDRVVIRAPSIRLRSQTDEIITQHAPNGANFRARDLIAAIEATERRTRPHSSFDGGIDIQHVYLDSLERDPNGIWYLEWGS